jgi:DNA phosphorothioation system restriction enzyme
MIGEWPAVGGKRTFCADETRAQFRLTMPPDHLRDLSRLVLQPEYRSDHDRPVHDFYIPCLEESSLYRRAVGYFTSEGLALASKGLAVFLRQEGTVRLIASPVLLPEDIAAIEQGHVAREDALGRALLRPLLPLDQAVAKQRLSVLAWLIAEGRLEIRLAVRCNAQGRMTHGIYHEKIGVFSDDRSNAVAFTGSANETVGGLVSNFESIDVFVSWDDPFGRVARKISNFERLWSNSTPGLVVLSFPDAVRERLLELRTPSRPVHDVDVVDAEDDVELAEEMRKPSVPQTPPDLYLREYQKDAIRAWFDQRGRGLFKMATGTGKTITALSLMTTLWEHLPEQGNALVVVIICPYRHLVTQWAEECARFNIFPLKCFESKARWAKDFDADLLAMQYGQLRFFPIVTTNSTFSSSAFQERLQRIENRLLIIADEVHNLGSSAFRHLLPDHAEYRLGLSATPERWYDEAGTEELLQYFGNVVFEYGLEQAITGGALTPYNYYPIVVELTAEESDEYVELSKAIAQRFAQNGDEANEGLKYLLLKRARLLANARNKLDALRQVVEPLRGTTHNLFYCGDGRVEYDPEGGDLKQLEAVVRLLGKEQGMRVDSYTADTYLNDRDRLRQEFAAGDLQGLVAIRCLDEGVDIPETRRAFILASSTNPKQFIQRRGRILRRAKGKELAEVYDFVVVPPLDLDDEETFNIDRRLLKRELQRFVEFARLARNAGQASAVLLPLKDKYHLLDVG